WRADDVLVHALPLYHVHGLFVAAHGALRANASMRWLDSFEPHAALWELTEGGGTVFMGVPTFYTRLLQATDVPNLSHVRLFTSGSAPLPARVHRDFQERTGQAILERYGMTEVGIVLSNPYDGERRPGAVGFPLPGVDARVVDPGADGVGELQIRGGSVFAGYHNRPDATAAAFNGDWMRTGDYAFVDEDGYIHLVGRRSDLILFGGLNIYPAEVEAVLIEQPGVRAVAVFGLPDDDLGEVPAAALVGDGLDIDAIRQAASAQLSGFKVPRRFVVVDALPRNTMGKVQKKRLREQYS
ncbi:MAG: AMP-binding protein, partial [Myxococcota bacterium]